MISSLPMYHFVCKAEVIPPVVNNYNVSCAKITNYLPSGYTVPLVVDITSLSYELAFTYSSGTVTYYNTDFVIP